MAGCQGSDHRTPNDQSNIGPTLARESSQRQYILLGQRLPDKACLLVRISSLFVKGFSVSYLMTPSVGLKDCVIVHIDFFIHSCVTRFFSHIFSHFFSRYNLPYTSCPSLCNSHDSCMSMFSLVFFIAFLSSINFSTWYIDLCL